MADIRERIAEIRRIATLPLGTNVTVTRQQRDELLGIAEKLVKLHEPQFDAMSSKQEGLLIQFCNEIAGPKGKACCHPDPVRLLEMAEAIYKAEME